MIEELQKKKSTFAGVGTIELGSSDMNCLSDTFIYDLTNKAWYCSNASYKPVGRYGE